MNTKERQPTEAENLKSHSIVVTYDTPTAFIKQPQTLLNLA